MQYPNPLLPFLHLDFLFPLILRAPFTPSWQSLLRWPLPHSACFSSLFPNNPSRSLFIEQTWRLWRSISDPVRRKQGDSCGMYTSHRGRHPWSKMPGSMQVSAYDLTKPHKTQGGKWQHFHLQTREQTQPFYAVRPKLSLWVAHKNSNPCCLTISLFTPPLFQHCFPELYCQNVRL